MKLKSYLLEAKDEEQFANILKEKQIALMKEHLDDLADSIKKIADVTDFKWEKRTDNATDFSVNHMSFRYKRDYHVSGDMSNSGYSIHLGMSYDPNKTKKHSDLVHDRNYFIPSATKMATVKKNLEKGVETLEKQRNSRE